MSNEETRPECYGIPERVMPRDEETGFIITQDDCTGCPHLSGCLKVALEASAERIRQRETKERWEGEGMPVGYEEYIRSRHKKEPGEEAEPDGVVGFFQRWSRMKREKQEKK